ncbi:MAG: Wzz/FepE/Etk N-terminal domain-containing protein [Eubacterium sp.]|nr:Wzz/FepE/Etk N-terminal domain-containing protein [Eubacterium sp.]
MDTRMESQRENQEIEIDLLELAGILLGRIGLILNVGLLAAILCFILSRFVLTPVYESTTKIYILNKTESASVTYSDVQMGTQLTKDYAELIGSRYVLEEVIQKLGLEEMTYNDLLDTVSVTTPTDTRIVSITVEHADPVMAMKIANCIREVAGEHIQNVMDIEAVNVVETANMPVKKAGPSVFRWTLIGGLVGALFVCAVILVQYLMDDTVKAAEDVEKYLGLSTLALIPVVEDVETRKKTKRKKRKRNFL